MGLPQSSHEIVGVIRARVKFFESLSRFRAVKPTWQAQKSLFPSLRRHWPEMDEKPREYRLALLMALLGRPVLTQHDLFWHEVKACLEVLNNESIFPADGVCAEEISMAIEGEFAGEAWNYPAVLITA